MRKSSWRCAHRAARMKCACRSCTCRAAAFIAPAAWHANWFHCLMSLACFGRVFGHELSSLPSSRPRPQSTRPRPRPRPPRPGCDLVQAPDHRGRDSHPRPRPPWTRRVLVATSATPLDGVDTTSVIPSAAVDAGHLSGDQTASLRMPSGKLQHALRHAQMTAYKFLLTHIVPANVSPSP